jgi:hypothetical protein
MSAWGFETSHRRERHGDTGTRRHGDWVMLVAASPRLPFAASLSRVSAVNLIAFPYTQSKSIKSINS